MLSKISDRDVVFEVRLEREREAAHRPPATDEGGRGGRQGRRGAQVGQRLAGWPGDRRPALAPRPPARRAARLTGVSGGPLQVQLFGRRDSRDTQKALRFFRERRIPVAFVDLALKPIAATELRRFSSRFAPATLIDQQSRAYRDSGLVFLRLDDVEIAERLLADQALLRLPLARAGEKLTIGFDERTWRDWISQDP